MRHSSAGAARQHGVLPSLSLLAFAVACCCLCQGALHMQEQLGWPVIPVTIRGGYELFPLKWNVNQCGKVRVCANKYAHQLRSARLSRPPLGINSCSRAPRGHHVSTRLCNVFSFQTCASRRECLCTSKWSPSEEVFALSLHLCFFFRGANRRGHLFPISVTGLILCYKCVDWRMCVWMMEGPAGVIFTRFVS